MAYSFLEKLDYLMSQKQLNKNLLSKESSIPYTTIDGWYKKGYEGLKLSTLKKLSNFLGVDIGYWVDENVLDFDSYKIKNPPAEKPQEDNVHNITDCIPEEDKQIYNLLYEIFVRMGFVKEGDAMTPQQVDFCAHMLGLMESAFKSNKMNGTDITRDIG